MHSITAEISSERFNLKPMTPADAPLFAELACDPDVVKTLMGDWSTPEKRLQNARDWIDDSEIKVIWAIYDRAGIFGKRDGFIGLCGVETPLQDAGEGPSIFYAYSKHTWGNGVASEVAKTVIAYLFNELNVAAVEALVYAGLNPASSRLLEKQGMKLVGRYPLVEYVGVESLPTMRYEIWRVETAEPGKAHTCLAEAAFKIGQFVADGVSTKEEMKTALGKAAETCGLTQSLGPDEVATIIDDSMNAGMAENGWLYYRLQRPVSEPRK